MGKFGQNHIFRLTAPIFIASCVMVSSLAIAAVSSSKASPTPPSTAGSSDPKNPATAAEPVAPSEAVKQTPSIKPATPVDDVTVVTRVVGEVGDHFVTSREVKINQAIESAINAKPGEAGEPAVLSGFEKSFPGEVARLLDEWMVYFEAKSLSSPLPSSADIGKNLKTIEEYWKGNKDWAALEVSPSELREMLGRKMLSRQFENLKSDPTLSPVSDEDAQLYFKQNRLKFGSLPFETFKDNIKAFLVKAQTERRIAEWHEILRRKYKVRNFIAG